MELILRVVAWPEYVEPGAALRARFDAGGGLIGRAETARLTLPDPRRTVSRFHAHVSCADGAYFLEDMGSINPAAVNDRPLSPGQKVELRPGDRIRVADYLIAVAFDDEDFPSTLVLDPPDAHDASARAADAGPALGAITVPLGPGEAGGPPLSAALPSASPGGARPAPAPSPAPSAAHSPAAAPTPGGTTPAPGPSAWPGAQSRLPPSSVDDLWRAFQSGARVNVELPYGLRPEMMHTLGAMLRSLVGGLRRLVVLRAEAKSELDSELTQLHTRNNNPLKFASDDTRALTALLRPPAAGFMHGPLAIEDAMSDLAHHSAAVLTALRTASERTLQRIEPKVLEAKSEGGVGSLLPMARKARLWDVYVEQHRLLCEDGNRDLREAFEQAFSQAYDEEVARLKHQQQRSAAQTSSAIDRVTRPAPR